MTLRKFGTGDGIVTEVEETGMSKEAVQDARQRWTPQDTAELEDEMKDGDGGKVPPTA